MGEGEGDRRHSPTRQVYNVRLGRVLGLTYADAIESDLYNAQFNLVSAPGQMAVSTGVDLPWVFENDAVRALAFIATDEIGMTGFVDAAELRVNAEAPSPEFEAAGFGEWQLMK